MPGIGWIEAMFEKHEHDIQNAETASKKYTDAEVYRLLPTETASGSVVSFTDGADDVPMKSLVVQINPVQDTSGGDPSPTNICPISGWSEVNVYHEDTYDASATAEITLSLGQTVYGGWVDVVSGEGEIDREFRTFDGSEVWRTNSSNGTATSVQGAGYKNVVLSSSYTCMSAGAGTGLGDYSCRLNPTLVNLLVRDPRGMTAEDYVPILQANPVSFVFELATPIPIHLTPQEIDSLLGDNTVWADSGDVEVTYKADLQKYIDNH